MKIIKTIIALTLLSTFAFAESNMVKQWKNSYEGKVKQGKIFYEGKEYKTVKIGKQEWMAENLNYKSKNNGRNICAGCEDFGRLYTWNSAMDIEQETKEDYDMERRIEGRPISKKHQGICPTGWHIPTVNDMRELLLYVPVDVFKDEKWWQDSFVEETKNDLNEFIFPQDGGRSREAMATMQEIGMRLCEREFWAETDKSVCYNTYGLSIRSSGTGEYRELDKCKSSLQMMTDFDTGKRICCSEGCAGDHFAMWLADENTSCYDKVTRGRHVCEYVPKAALFRLQQYGGVFLQDIDWEYKNSYASVRCLKD